MKILSIKALNINSLKGKTEIDFEALTQQSALFAITGPTGSGKSTILDIISCALYGRTARLKNPNDLMSRHAGEAYCEVEFEIKNKHYRSSWSQRRARKKYDGAFQSAKMELVDLDNDKILPLKSREVPKKVEELSGLDYGRFMQSMLLAQGGFDAFLKADEKERSVLLEKITGTQIYAEISKTVFEKYRIAQQELENQKSVLDSIELLDDRQKENLEQRLHTNLELKEQTQTELSKIVTSLHWLENLKELEEEHRVYSEAFLAAQKQKEQHKESFEKVALANKALRVSPLFSSLRQLQEKLSEDKALLKQVSCEIEEINVEIRTKEKEYETMQKALVSATALYSSQSTALKKAREIATQEKEILTQLATENQAFKVKHEELELQKESLDAILTRYETLSKHKESSELYLRKHSSDEKLLARIELIAQTIASYKELSSAYLEGEKTLVELQGEYKTQEEAFLSKGREVEKLHILFEQKELAYRDLAQKSKDDVTLEEHTQEKLKRVELLQKELQEYEHLNQKSREEEHIYEQCITQAASLNEMIAMKQQQLSQLKEHIAVLREKQEKEQLLQKYEADRARLTDGEPCFLCGSRQHPFAHTAVEHDIDRTKEAIRDEETKLELQEEALKELERRFGIAQTKAESSQLEIQKLSVETERIRTLFEKYDFAADKESQRELQDAKAVLEQRLHSIKQNRLEKEKLLQDREDAREAYQSRVTVQQELKHTLEKVANKKEQQSHELDIYTSKREEITKLLEEYLNEFQQHLELEKLDVIYAGLLERKEKYVQNMEKLKEHEEALSRCSMQKKESETAVMLLEKELVLLQKKIQTLKEVFTQLSAKRIALLNVSDLDLYEQEINAAYKKIQEQEHSSRALLGELGVKIKERVLNKESLEKKVAHSEQKSAGIQKEFQDALQESGFEDSSAFELAMLQSSEREALEKFCQKMDADYKEMQTLKAQSFKKLQEHQNKSLSKRPTEELEILRALLEQKSDALQESIGSDKKELEFNEMNTQKFQEKLASINKCEEHLSIWIKLNELIGSADGAKFKKFAQGITLDQLINLANHHLAILSERYRLSRSEEKLLELEIIDAYQGNAVRPVSTLSGGESFIVSLALALGLSELASQKISIDSLFLDEGFGTLDEESLETALNALNLLQSGGKMVGVISHVEALKERIPLQIKVVPRGDGVSFVEVDNLHTINKK